MDTGLISVGALLYSKKTNRFLFLLRNNSSYNGLWGLVGGKVHKRESIGKALHREIKEELGTQVVMEKIIPIDLFTSDNKNFRYNTYIVIVEEEFIPTLNEEHRGYCWCEIDDVPSPVHPGLATTLKQAIIQSKISTAIKTI